MSRRWLWGLPLLALPCLALLAYGLTRDTYVLPSPLPGNPAPAFDLERLEGGDSLALADLEGEVVVLNFWASWCGPCRVEHPVLTRIQRSYEDRGVRVVGIVYQDSRSAARAFLDDMGGSWTNVLDPGSRTAIDYGVFGVPETFFLSREGLVAAKRIGPVTWGDASARLDSLLVASTASRSAPSSSTASRPAPSSSAASRPAPSPPTASPPGASAPAPSSLAAGAHP